MTGEQLAFFLDEEELVNGHKKVGKRKRRSSKPGRFDCAHCSLDKKCNSPRMERYGKGKKDILMVGLAPGNVEDKKGRPFIGPSGKLLRRTVSIFDIDLDRDCVCTNIVACRLPRNQKKPTTLQLKCCAEHLKKDIFEVNPKLIICLGMPSITEILRYTTLSKLSMKKMHGRIIPSQQYNCWVGCSYHPSYILRKENSDLATLFSCDMAELLEYVDKPLPNILETKDDEIITDSDRAIKYIESLCNSKRPVAFDYEANCLSPFDENAALLTVSFSEDVNKGVCIPLGKGNWNSVENAFVYEALKSFLVSKAPKYIQNYGFEELWSRIHLNVSINNVKQDTMVAEHIIWCRRGTTSLAFQVYCLTGHEYKDDVDITDLENTPLEDIAEHNNLDSRYTLMSGKEHKKRLKGNLRRFNNFLLRCQSTLCNLTERGVHIDTEVLFGLRDKAISKIKQFEDGVKEFDAVNSYKKEYGQDFKISSPRDKARLLYDIFKIKPLKYAKGGSRTVDKDVLGRILKTVKGDAKDVINLFLQWQKSDTMRKTTENYSGLLDSDNYVHPTYNMNITETFRSSATDPNIQNPPVRDEMLSKFRKCIIASPGRELYEVDYAGSEVCVLGMYSKDPSLVGEIIDGVDTHRYWAGRIFKRDQKDITYDERFDVKGGFVFASFYGSTPPNIARSFNLSEAFIEHIQRKFWIRYKDVKRWQRQQIKFYKQEGYIETFMGSRRFAPLTDFQIYNTPIQATSFHLLLDALVRIDNELWKKGFKSYPIAEIHDSIVFDMVPKEADDVVDISTKILTSKRFDWQGDVPMRVGWKYGKNWYDMEEI